MSALRLTQFGNSGVYRQIFELVRSFQNPVDLSLGQPNFDVPDEVKLAAIEAINVGHNRYGNTKGLPALVDKIKGMLVEEGSKAEDVMVTTGGTGGLVLAALSMINPGDEVLVPDPYFAIYEQIIRLAGGLPKIIDTAPSYRLTPEMIAAATGPSTRFLIFNSPANPTGVAYSEAEISSLVKQTKALGLRVVADEVYDLFTYDRAHESWLKHDADAVLVRSFSKTFAMPGWRVGFVAGPEQIIEDMAVLQQFIYPCAHVPSQIACVKALDLDMTPQRIAYAKKRDIVYEGLASHYDLPRPEGAFYAFPRIPNGDWTEFLKRCLAEKLVVVPGRAFSKQGDRFRISFAVDDELLEHAVKILVQIAKKMG